MLHYLVIRIKLVAVRTAVLSVAVCAVSTPTLFSENRFSFIRGRSINDVYFFVNKFIHENLNFSNKVVGIFLDIK